ncbi:4-(cytidine 5'-diphospho)-2-C-methyl-D-erythritol kinase [Fusibacter paucivorans]|uniref:4-diphosphocytidyl-2-C-methyl-D-erythritol kinase n=1 Tax=Fusibacter paucivorans TaxID=76009 RepID=A0ABS5PN36_9FIRM|nr:4-(cytidine 5'-diphospho)-2-C-methyl-D-erythritol kinase [Fusibacter paucivorans]MBS7526573.1 4-(cytidine 5'-diphospho)-2-C-methyl-D-erythritol kinase [Fusibacter paucivorans]
MTAAVTVKAHAKINLTLDVIGKRTDGYHDVEMIMQQISLHDVVTISQRHEDLAINLTSTVSHLPTDSTNLAYRAAMLMREVYGIQSGFNIHIEKHIPVAAGLAGGSTDAAAVITGIAKLMALPVETASLEAVGLKIGADVPFCIRGGCVIARGLGEILEPIKGLEYVWLLLVKPNFGVSTKEVYGNLDLSAIKAKPNTQAMVAAIRDNQRMTVISELCNVLETVTIKRYPEVGMIKKQLVSFGAEGVLMSGSGPTVFGFFKDLNRAKLAHKKMKRFYHQSYIVTTYNGEISHKGDMKGEF